MNSQAYLPLVLATFVIAVGTAVDLSASQASLATAIGQTPHDFVAGIAFIAALIAGLMGVEAILQRSHPAGSKRISPTFEPRASSLFHGRVTQDPVR